MKKAVVLIIFSALVTSRLYGQKRLIDTSVYGKWPEVLASEAKISNNGRFVAYTINNQPERHNSIIIQNITSKEKISFIDGQFLGFTQNSKEALVHSDNRFHLINLISNTSEVLTHALNAVLTGSLRSEFLLYNVSEKQKLFCRNIRTGKVHAYENVTSFDLSRNGDVVILHRSSEQGPLLQWLELETGSCQTILKGDTTNNAVFNHNTNGAAFYTLKSGEPNVLWLFNKAANKIQELTNQEDFSKKENLELSTIQQFTDDDQCVLFKAKDRASDIQKPSKVLVPLTIWNYRDKFIPPYQEKRSNYPDDIWVYNENKSYIFSFSFSTIKYIRLQNKYDDLAISGRFGIVKSYNGAVKSLEDGWNRYGQLLRISLVNLATGEKEILNSSHGYTYTLSPTGRYLFFYDTLTRTFNVRKTISREPMRVIASEIELGTSLHGGVNSMNRNYLTWLNLDRVLLINGEYDIWQFDPEGKKKAFNLTNKYGINNDVVFDYMPSANKKGNADRIYLKAFNVRTKENGFFSKFLNEEGDPAKLIFGPRLYHWNKFDSVNICAIGDLLKASGATMYLFGECTASDAVNLFATPDFKVMIPLTNNHPQKEYNWLTTELLNYHTLDGTPSAGVLYKPENFDRRKKYPIIFWYYEQTSNGLNVFKTPKPASGDLDIPTMVSQGYLVFTPDIPYKIGAPFQSAYNSVVGSALELAKYSFVDTSHMGIQGHSFGGAETNYIVTHTDIFAAACSASGFVDLVSDYGTINELKRPGQIFFERKGHQGRMEKTLWQSKAAYIEESSILNADKITTPLLLMHGGSDKRVLFSQSTEFFTALRRLGKRSWLLEYDNEDHILEEPAALDFTIRMQQFFDHYLKGAPAPKWMVEGIPYEKKGIDDGLELMPPGVTPGPGIAIDTLQTNSNFKKP